MRIVKVSGHACVRVQKMAIPLVERGHKVHLIALAIPTYHEAYATCNYCASPQQMQNAIRQFGNADVFHVHNEPSYFVSMIKEIFPDKPVILDIHDSQVARLTQEEYEAEMDKGNFVVRVTAEERNNFQLADGLVFPGKHFAEVVMNEYKLDQPYEVIPSAIPLSWYRYNMREYLGGLVYEGRINTKEEIAASPALHGFRYCDYEELANQLYKKGIDFHLYTIRNASDVKFGAIYSDIAICHEPENMKGLVKALSRHDWGLVGNIFHTPEWEVAFPNKMFEYIAASVPIVAMNAKACEEFITEHKIGISVKSVDELAERWGEHRELRKNLIKKRNSFSMDSHIHKLEELYASLI